MNNYEYLDSCGCCENGFEEAGVTSNFKRKSFPLTIYNRPGLSDIKYRLATFSRFRSEIIKEMSFSRSLTSLAAAAQSSGNFAIALLEAWATVADVITFYQERIANESYLRTAKERLSVLQLARSIGYELRPGVAASCRVAFTLEDAEGTIEKSVIDIGTKFQSLPAQDEMPQVFETIEKIVATPQFNHIKPKLTSTQLLEKTKTRFYFKGINNQLKKGDGLLVVKGGEFVTFNIISDVNLDPLADKTLVTVYRVSDSLGSPADFSDKDVVYVFRIKAGIFGHNAPRFEPLKKIKVTKGLRDWDTDQVIINENSKKIIPSSSGSGGRPDEEVEEGVSRYYNSEGNLVYLDNSVSSILPGSWTVIMSSKGDSYACRSYQVKDIREETISEFALTARVTGLTLKINKVAELADFELRKTSVFAQNEEIHLAEEPDERSIENNSMSLDRVVSGLQIGQQVCVSGKTVKSDGVETGLSESEIAVISNTENIEDSTKITFENKLKNSYKANTVLLNANIATATHGETKHEVLGSGESTQRYQEFLLKEKPLTYVSAATRESVRSTLEVRVNDVLWREVPSTYYLRPNDHAYTVRIENDGQARIIFGNGIKGTKLPLGVENITAKYRIGTGRSGLLKKDQLTLLMSRPLGVLSVTNPNEPIGADDPENLEQARGNAPLSVTTMDRIVSLMDFENFARAFAGIGKAQATLIWDGEKKVVHITIASSNGQDVTRGSPIFDNLVGAIEEIKDPMIRFTVDSFRLLMFDIKARIRVRKEIELEKIKNEIKNTLIKRYSFESRIFGQSVNISEIMSVIHLVNGVEAIDIDEFHLSDTADKKHETSIAVNLATWDDRQGKILPAELLIVNINGIKLEEML